MSGQNDLEVLEKRVNESRVYDFSFSAKMVDVENISSVLSLVSAATTTGPTALTLGTPAIAGKQVQVRISGGSNGGLYLQTCKVLTNQNNTLQCEGYLLVREP